MCRIAKPLYSKFINKRYKNSIIYYSRNVLKHFDCSVVKLKLYPVNETQLPENFVDFENLIAAFEDK